MKALFVKLFLYIVIIGNYKVCLSNGVTGYWNSNDGGTHVQIVIEPCKSDASMMCGKIHHLELAGHHTLPYLDRHNSDESLQNRPLIGLEVMRDMVLDPDTPNSWKGGSLYNPEDGKTYSCAIKLVQNDKGAPKLEACIYIFTKLIGETRYWTR